MEIKEAVKIYLAGEISNGKEPTVLDFVKLNKAFVRKNTPTENPIDFWNGIFSSAARELNIQMVCSKQKIPWDKILCAKEEGNHDDNASSRGTKRTRSSGSKTDSHPLSQAMKDQYEKTFKAMKNDEKWQLSDGTYVEDLMYEYAKDATHEHPAHSFILDVEDTCWNGPISEQQMLEIINAGIPAFPKYSQGAKNIIDELSTILQEAWASRSSRSSVVEAEEDKKVINAIWKKITSYGFFDPEQQTEESWVQKTILEILDLYRWGVLSWIGDHGSEMDFVARIWVLLDKAFDDLHIETRRDQTSIATVLSNNQDRGVTGFSSIDAKLPSIRPDLIFFRNNTEFGAAECGKEHCTGISKKQIIESQLHLPKTMKTMFNHAVSRSDNKISLIRSLRAVGFHQFNLEMRASVLDSPGGYVCRLRTTPAYEISQRPSLMSSGLLQILRLTLKMKEAVRISIHDVETHMAAKDEDEEPDVVCNLRKPSTLVLPPVASEKKQKTT